MSDKKHVLSFSPDGKLFALINDQGILRIWSTETNQLRQEYTPNLHLEGPCTAIAWISAAMELRKKNVSGQPVNSESTLYLALGTSTGKVSLYSYALGKIERDLKGEGHTGKVTHMTQDDKGMLYTCGVDCYVVVWSLLEERQVAKWSTGNEKAHSIVYLKRSEALVIGTRQIKVFSIKTQKVVQTFIGHTSDVNLMVTCVDDNNTEYVATTSRMERVVSLWKIGQKGQNQPSVSTMLMEDVAYCLSCKMASDNTMQVASITRSGVIHIYIFVLERIKSQKPMEPKVTVEVASSSVNFNEPIAVLAASFHHSARPEDILFGYGDKHFMVFEYLPMSFTDKTLVLERVHPKEKVLAKSNKKDKETSAIIKTLAPQINKKTVEYKTSVGASRNKLKTFDMPMESRLQRIGESGGSLQPQSKVQLLVQALHSKDESLLRSVLCTEDLKIIRLTLHNLPVQYFGVLVDQLTLLMQRSHKNVEISLRWLKILAQTHSSQLMALGIDDLREKFGPCIGIMEYRADCLKELSKLNGRLQLLVTQIKRNVTADELNTSNVLVYEDSDAENDDEYHFKSDPDDDDGINEDDVRVEAMDIED